MPINHLLPIPLPHGRTGDEGHLSVFLSPRLLENGALSTYQAWSRWSDVASRLVLRVLVDGVEVDASRVGVHPDPNLWAAAFRGVTPVRGYRFVDWSSVDLDALATSDFDDTILALYADIAAAHPTDPPSQAATLATAPAQALLAPGGPIDEAVDHVRPMEGDDILDAPEAPRWDFHAFVALLGHHPELLRHLGLVIDLRIDLSGHQNPSSVVVRTDFENRSPQGIEIPVEMVTTDDFLANPNRETPDEEPGRYWEQTGGFLRLQDQEAYASLLDPVGAAARLTQLPGPDHRDDKGDDAGPDETEGTGALPALSTRALTLVRPDLTTAFENRTTRQGEIEEEIDAFLSSLPPDRKLPRLFAEDVSRGHRIDVLDLSAPGEKGPEWHSLFERTSEAGYRFPSDPTLDRPAPDDEGWTTTRLVTEHNEWPEETGDDHHPIVPLATRRLDDQLYRWDGWSGAAPRPSGAIDSVTGEPAEVEPQEPTQPTDPLQFAVEYQAGPCSLPRLRFSHRYRMRARTVDLGGWSTALGTASSPQVETDETPFGRLEPVASPTVVRRHPRPSPGVGDHAATIVLLSDYDIDDDKVDDGERLLFPGRVGQDLCELHGQPAGGAAAASYADLAARDRVRPEDGWTTDARSGEPIAGRADRHRIDYLADPMIESLRVHAPTHRLTEVVPLNEQWPALTSLRLVATAGPGDPVTVRPSADVDVLVNLAKADIWSLDLSYGIGEQAIGDFGLWYQLEKDEQQELEELIRSGGHWMFSARQTVRLVHAVRRPLADPAIGELSGTRTRGSTAVTLASDDIDIERRSTGTIALRARWTDLVDDPALPAPTGRSSGAFLGRFTTPRAEADEPFTFGDHRVDLGDTRRHAATVDIEAFSAFSSYFTEERTITVPAEGSVEVEVDPRGIAAGTAVITADGHSTTAFVDHLVDEAAGVVSFPADSSLAEGQELLVRYIPRPVSRTTADAYELVFPNTAIPPRPEILEANPAFERRRTRKADTETVRHDGRVVRIHLARPWNLTGDGEALAVLVDRSGGDGGSQVARDPLLAGGVDPLSADQFRLASSVVDGDGLGRDADGHDLAIHPVVWDDDLGHWYVDVAIDIESHRPFVTLVVARYQGDSIPGRQVGPSVTLDPIRLGPERTVEAMRSSDAYEVLVTGSTHDGVAIDDSVSQNGGKQLGANTFVVRVQQADPSIVDPDLRWADDVNQVPLVPTAENGHTGWGGKVPHPKGGLPHRLVIEERQPALTGAKLAEVTDLVVHDEIVDFGETIDLSAG